MQRRQLWGFRNVGTNATSNLVRLPAFGSLARLFYKKNYKPTNKARKLWCPVKCSFHMLVVVWFIFWMNCRVTEGNAKDRVMPHTHTHTHTHTVPATPRTVILDHSTCTTQGLRNRALDVVYTEAQYIALTEKIFCLTFWRQNFFLILAHPVYKMWIIQEPNTLELWNKLHFEEKKRRVYTMFKIFITCICWINI